jgi:hypothetical protein
MLRLLYIMPAGLASLTALQQLCSLQLSVKVARTLAQSGKDSDVQAWLQQDLRQIVTAVGQLTQLRKLRLAIDPGGYGPRTPNRFFKEIGRDTFGPLSSLTQLLSLSLSYSVLSSGSGLSQLSGLTKLTSFSLNEFGRLRDGVIGQRGVRTHALDRFQEAGVGALAVLWPLLQLQRLRLRVGNSWKDTLWRSLQPSHLRVLDVNGSFVGRAAQLAQLTALQVGGTEYCYSAGAQRLRALVVISPVSSVVSCCAAAQLASLSQRAVCLPLHLIAVAPVLIALSCLHASAASHQCALVHCQLLPSRALLYSQVCCMLLCFQSTHVVTLLQMLSYDRSSTSPAATWMLMTWQQQQHQASASS